MQLSENDLYDFAINRIIWMLILILSMKEAEAFFAKCIYVFHFLRIKKERKTP
jgi:hypothetical protein